MKYFIDFEALQYTGEIISVGCVDENGREFYSLVQPKKIKKLTEFITNLTGVTKADLEDAPSTDEVFAAFYNWLDSSSKAEFFCYGNNDEIFVARTLKNVTNFFAQCALCLIKSNLTDYAIHISRHFGIKQSIGLKKLVEYYRNEEITQNHNALEDARFLKEVYEKSSEEEPMECPFPEYVPKVKEKTKKSNTNKKKPKVTAAKGKKILKFRNISTAANWVISSELHNKVAYTDETRNKIGESIKNAAKNNIIYCGCSWSVPEIE